jgi:cytochrome c oxidase cbb3-type subunit 2
MADPRSVVPESVMPSYAWLARTPLPLGTLGGQLRAQRAVGVPYTDQMIENAAGDATAQASPDGGDTRGLTGRYGAATHVRTFDGNPQSVTEMDAMVAYLQVLGRLTDVASRPHGAGE